MLAFNSEFILPLNYNMLHATLIFFIETYWCFYLISLLRKPYYLGNTTDIWYAYKLFILNILSKYLFPLDSEKMARLLCSEIYP